MTAPTAPTPPTDGTLGRPPLSLAIVIDRSGSMHGPPIEDAKAKKVTSVKPYELARWLPWSEASPLRARDRRTRPGDRG